MSKPRKPSIAKVGGNKPSRGKKTQKPDAQGGDQPMLIPPSRDMLHHIQTYQILKAKVDKANSDLRNAVKGAEEAGINIQSMKNGLTLFKKDKLAQKSYLSQLSMVLDALGAPVKFNVHDAKYKDDIAQAKIEGFADGKAARNKNNCYTDGSPAAAAYDESYNAGQLENMPKGPTPKAPPRVVGGTDASTAIQ